MLVHLRFHSESILNFCSWALDPCLTSAVHRFQLKSLDFSIQVFRLENYEDPKVFNYFYLLRYFFGYRAQIRSVKKHFVLGTHYQNLELGFRLRGLSIYYPMTVWLFEVQPLVNLSLTRDYVLDSKNFRWLLRDLSVFSERKTNAGLFYLEDPLGITVSYRVYMDGVVPLSFYKQLLECLKVVL